MTRPIALVRATVLVGEVAPPEAYDVVIRGGGVLGSAGNPWITADIAIKDGGIVRVGVVEVNARQPSVNGIARS